MVIQSALKRIYSNWTEGFRASVKQILACSLILMGFTQMAFAQQACESIFDVGLPLGLPKTLEKWYPREGGPSMDEHNFNLLGKLGNLYDLMQDPATGKIQAVKNKSFFEKSRRQLKKRFKDAPEPASKEFVARVETLMQARELPDGLVMIKFNQDHQGYDPFVPGHRASGLLINRFFRTYENLVAFSYRLSGLEENSVTASVHMHLETKLLRSNSQRFDFHLVFDKKVWLELLRILEKDIEIVENTSWNSSANKLATQRIIGVNEPLYPMAGVALKSDRKNPNSPMEIKRYFKNDYEDPLGLVGVAEKNEYRARHEMLYEVFKTLSPGQALEIHAHSLVHAKAYMRLGFKRTEIMENPLYPGIQVHLLKATREEAMEKIAAVIRDLK